MRGITGASWWFGWFDYYHVPQGMWCSVSAEGAGIMGGPIPGSVCAQPIRVQSWGLRAWSPPLSLPPSHTHSPVRATSRFCSNSEVKTVGAAQRCAPVLLYQMFSTGWKQRHGSHHTHSTRCTFKLHVAVWDARLVSFFFSLLCVKLFRRGQQGVASGSTGDLEGGEEEGEERRTFPCEPLLWLAGLVGVWLLLDASHVLWLERRERERQE